MWLLTHRVLVLDLVLKWVYKKFVVLPLLARQAWNKFRKLNNPLWISTPSPPRWLSGLWPSLAFHHWRGSMLSNGSGSSALYLAISFLAICSGVACCESPSLPPVYKIPSKNLLSFLLAACCAVSCWSLCSLCSDPSVLHSNLIKKFTAKCTSLLSASLRKGITLNVGSKCILDTLCECIVGVLCCQCTWEEFVK